MISPCRTPACEGRIWGRSKRLRRIKTGHRLHLDKYICSFTEEQFVNLPELYETLHDEGTDGDVVEMQASKSR